MNLICILQHQPFDLLLFNATTNEGLVSHGPKEKIKLMVEETEARRRVIWWVNKHTGWGCVAAAVNEVGQKHRTLAAIKKKWFGN